MQEVGGVDGPGQPMMHNSLDPANMESYIDQIRLELVHDVSPVPPQLTYPTFSPILFVSYTIHVVTDAVYKWSRWYPGKNPEEGCEVQGKRAR